jgi:hypothetical protein
LSILIALDMADAADDLNAIKTANAEDLSDKDFVKGLIREAKDFLR